MATLLIRIIRKVEDLVVLAKPVGVKMLVRIIKQNAFSISVVQISAPTHCLTEGCRILKGKTVFTKSIPRVHPATNCRSRSTVAFVDKNKIVAFKRINRNPLVTHVLVQFMHIKYFYCMADEKPPAILIEQIRRDT